MEFTVHPLPATPPSLTCGLRRCLAGKPPQEYVCTTVELNTFSHTRFLSAITSHTLCIDRNSYIQFTSTFSSLYQMGSPVPNARRRLLSYYGPDSCPITTYLLPPFTAHTKHTFLLPLVRELLPVWTRIIFSLPFRRLEFATTQYSPSPEDSVVRSQDAT